MRRLAAIATIAATVLVSLAIDGAGLPAPMAAIVDYKAEGPPKPPGASRPGNDSCRWAFDMECDEPGIGTGACAVGTDYSDCRAIRAGDDDSCRWAHDGECDEPHFGTGACTQGTDRSDCGNIAWMRNQDDTCASAFNGICEDSSRQAGGACAPRTDRSDCYGRDRPLSINDHFFGHDDRVLVPVADAPWRFMGVLRMDWGGACSATLVARDVLITAAHCIHSDTAVNANGVFVSAFGNHRARITAYLIDRRYDIGRYTTTNDIDGLDWALLRIDQPLGDELGHAGIASITGQGEQHARAASLLQAGYAWDTGDHLSGHVGCNIVSIHADNTFRHACDTTRGDSGSAFLVSNGDGFDVIGVDSKFRSNPGGSFIYVAVSAASFAAQAPDFVAGRTGVRVGRGPSPPKR